MPIPNLFKNFLTISLVCALLTQGKEIEVNGNITIDEAIKNDSVVFASGDYPKSLTLNASENTISSLTIQGYSINNHLILKTGKTTIANSISVEEIQGLSIKIEEDINLVLGDKGINILGAASFDFLGNNGTIFGNIDMTTSEERVWEEIEGSVEFNFYGLRNQSLTATINGAITFSESSEHLFNIKNHSTIFRNGTKDKPLLFSSGVTQIILKQPDSTLQWQYLDGNSQPIYTSGGSTTIDFTAKSTLDTDVITMGGNTTITIEDGIDATITGKIVNIQNTSRRGTPTTDVILLVNSSLVIGGEENTITTLTLGENNIVSLAPREGETRSRKSGKKLTIERIKEGKDSSLTLIAQVGKNKSDTFIINDKTSNGGGGYTKYFLGTVLEKDVKIQDTKQSLIALVKTSTGITFPNETQMVSGFSTTTLSLTTQEKDGYTHYFIKEISREITQADQRATQTAFTLNYDLYMANFNSLNKRMGELRENPYSQGVWARIFNGSQNIEFGLGSTSNYTTIQAGYDYAFGFDGAKNYLGMALSYALSTSKINSKAIDLAKEEREIEDIYSNAVEVALYNSYVSDSGWYNDSVVKFSYISNHFEINNSNQNTHTNNSLKNFALTLSDEVGYRFSVGTNKEWGITPQLEIGFGFLNQNNFKQTLENSDDFLDSICDALSVFRTRVGSSFSYDFKNFTHDKSFNASIYLGVFYEYDYLKGGDITMNANNELQKHNSSNLRSSGRITTNFGVNFSIKDNTKIYFDLEKSFVGKITTNYQVNLGVRYSFGSLN